MTLFFVVFFFFKQKTAYEMRISDWSSDVCSSDLASCPRQSPERSAVCSCAPRRPTATRRDNGASWNFAKRIFRACGKKPDRGEAREQRSMRDRKSVV